MNENPETSTVECREEGPLTFVLSPKGGEGRVRGNRRTPHLHSVAAFVALSLLVGLAYGNSLLNGFSLDDRVLIVENKLLTTWDTLPLVLLSDYWLVRLNPYGDPPFFSGLYRPLPMASYALNYGLGDLHPMGYHLVNIVLHLLVSWMVYLFARQLKLVPEGAFIAAAVFAVHPLHTEAVSSVIGRTELLMALGVLSSLWFAGRGQRALSIAAFSVGLLSKEQAMMLPLLLFLTDACSRERVLGSPGQRITEAWQHRDLRAFAGRYGAYILALAVFLLLRNYALSGRILAHVGFLENPAAYVETWARVLTAMKVAGAYLWLCVWPITLSADYSYDAIPAVQSFLDWKVLAGLLAWGSLLSLAVWSFVKGDRRVTLSVGLTVITFLPVSNLVMPIGTLMGERLFYLPSAGLCLLLGLGYERLLTSLRSRVRLRKQPSLYPNLNLSLFLRVVLVAVCVAMIVRTVARNLDWANSETLFRSAVQVVPNSAKAHVVLGDELRQKPSQEARQQAFDSYQTALRIYPEYLYKDPKLAESLVQLRRELSAERRSTNDER